MTLTRTHRAARFAVAALLAHAVGACARYVQVPPQCPPSPPPPPAARARLPGEPATLRGVVRSLPDSQAVWQAEAFVLGTERRTVTDSAGAFRFDTLPPGRYTLRVRRIGYFIQRVDALDVDTAGGAAVVVPLERAVLDGCPGFMVFYERVPWWKVWRW